MSLPASASKSDYWTFWESGASQLASKSSSTSSIDSKMTSLSKFSNSLNLSAHMLSRTRKKMQSTHNFAEIFNEYSEKAKAARKKTRLPKRPVLFILGFALVILFLNWVCGEEFAAKSSSVESATKSPSKETRIAIVTFTTKETSYTHLSLSNKNAYAKKHGYDLIVDYEARDPKGTMWHKFIMLDEVMAAGNHDWIWWIDFDTLITNSTIKLSDIISESLSNFTDPNEVDFLLTADCFQLNAGSMLVRSGPRAHAFLDRVRKYGDEHKKLNEQDCIRDVINRNSDGEQDHAKWIPQWKINAFPDEIRCWDKDKRGWEFGMFAVHFAGAWAHVKEEDPAGYLMRKYSKKIVH